MIEGGRIRYPDETRKMNLQLVASIVLILKSKILKSQDVRSKRKVTHKGTDRGKDKKKRL